MSELRIAQVRVRGILDSRGEPTIETDVELDGGACGRGSAPLAVAPGRRERRRSRVATLGPGAGSPELECACRSLRRATFSSLEDFDWALEALADAGATLALSAAFCRAACVVEERPLYDYLADAAGTTPDVPHPLVNVISGGIHLSPQANTFQQIMIVPRTGSIFEDVGVALEAFDAVERWLASRGEHRRLSASSGFVIEGASSERLLYELADEAARQEWGAVVGLGVDVAAEHLEAGGGRYRLDGRELSGEDLLAFLERLATELDLVYLEDPFAPEHEQLWRALAERLPSTCLLVGDDLFATDATRVDRSLARGILLKPSQAGTITATLAAARAARAAGMDLCVSHRSGETEDTFVCDLAFAVGARYQKVGGPRRGDRIAKYNQLLRLAEQAAPAPETDITQRPRPLSTVEGR